MRTLRVKEWVLKVAMRLFPRFIPWHASALPGMGVC